MPGTQTIDSAQIHALLAEKGFDVHDESPNLFTIKQPDSGITIQAVLEGEILFFSLTCLTLPDQKLTPAALRLMLNADNGISTSHFQLYPAGNGTTAVALSNFCKLQELGSDDQDDILSCVDFLLADVMEARTLLKGLA